MMTTAPITPADVIRQTRHQKESVYDPYNNPDSASVYDGSNPVTMTRPAGYGHDEDRLIDIAGQPYQHILALDVTPIASADSDGNLTIPEKPENFDVTNAAYVHVCSRDVFHQSDQRRSIRQNAGGIGPAWRKLKIRKKNLQYRLWRAKQISSAAYTSDSYANLQAAIDEVTTQAGKYLALSANYYERNRNSAPSQYSNRRNLPTKNRPRWFKSSTMPLTAWRKLAIRPISTLLSPKQSAR